MYAHILAATDGSELGTAAVRKGARLARATAARLTIAHVGVRYVPPLYTGDFVPGTLLSPQEHDEQVRQAAEQVFTRARAIAAEERCDCDTAFAMEDQPFQGLIHIAQQNHCDLIVIASHGRSALTAWLLGSETHKLLAHCAFDTLVVR